MFLNYNKITPFQNKLIKAFRLFEDSILKLHDKETNEFDLLGTSKVSNEIQIIYIAILLGIIEYDNTLKIKNYTTDSDKFKSELACNGIDLHKVYKTFGLLNDDVLGINTLEVERNFIIESSVFKQETIYTKVDINELIEQEEYCEYVIPNNKTKVYLLVEDSNKQTFLEL